MELEKSKLFDNKVKIKDENGFEKDYEVISLIRTKDGNFLVYTDGKLLKNGAISLYVNSIIESDDGVTLDFVSDEEMKYVISNLRERMDND